jgi:hypothetical protein
MNLTLELTPADLQSLARIMDAATRGAGLQIVRDVANISEKLEAAAAAAHVDRLTRPAPGEGNGG